MALMGNESRRWDKSPGPLAPASCYEAEPRSPREQQEPGGGEEEEEPGARPTGPGSPAGPFRPLSQPARTVPPPAPPPGGAGPPPCLHGNARPSRLPWPPCRGAAHLAPSPSLLGCPRPCHGAGRGGAPYSPAAAGDPGRSSRRWALTRASTWSGCWAHLDGLKASYPLGPHILERHPTPNIHPRGQEAESQD